MKKFFGIEKGYNFEWYDITACFTVLNVLFVILGFNWAPIFGILNCCICLILNIVYRAHINSYITQIALFILNFYFLFG